MRRTFPIVWVWVALVPMLLSGCINEYDFNTGSNMGWTTAGLYEDGTLTPIAGHFGQGGAGWSDSVNDPGAPPAYDPLGDENGSITLGSGGSYFPAGPGGFWAWHFNSPDLSTDTNWQDADRIVAGFTGIISSINYNSQIWAQFVLKVKKPDGNTSYFTDGIFHEIPINVDYGSNSWHGFALEISSLGMPTGSVILNINIRIFGTPDTYDGFIHLDNVFPRHS